MEDINKVLSLFDNQDKWNAFVELANMKGELVIELQRRLAEKLSEDYASIMEENGWELDISNYTKFITMLPKKAKEKALIGIQIAEIYWNEPWGLRNVFVCFNPVEYRNKGKDVNDFFKHLRNCHIPAMSAYEDNLQQEWVPFSRTIPAEVFGVDKNTSSLEQCLYLAKDHADILAQRLWEEVFKPFATPEIAAIFTKAVL